MTQRSQQITDRIVKGFNELADSLASGKKITAAFTCSKVMLDLHPVAYRPESVKATRKLLRVSQALFAQFIGVDVSTVQAWEQGRAEPMNMACRFMDEIQRDPDYWRNRLRESIKVKQAV